VHCRPRETREEKRRKEHIYTAAAYIVHDGDVPKVAATDFTDNNNAARKRERGRTAGINPE